MKDRVERRPRFHNSCPCLPLFSGGECKFNEKAERVYQREREREAGEPY